MSDEFVRGTDGIRATGAGRCGAEIGPLDAKCYGYLSGGDIGNHHRGQERAYAVWTFFHEHLGLFKEGGQPANAAANDDPNVVVVGVVEFQTR